MKRLNTCTLFIFSKSPVIMKIHPLVFTNRIILLRWHFSCLPTHSYYTIIASFPDSAQIFVTALTSEPRDLIREISLLGDTNPKIPVCWPPSIPISSLCLLNSLSRSSRMLISFLGSCEPEVVVGFSFESLEMSKEEVEDAGVSLDGSWLEDWEESALEVLCNGLQLRLPCDLSCSSRSLLSPSSCLQTKVTVKCKISVSRILRTQAKGQTISWHSNFAIQYSAVQSQKCCRTLAVLLHIYTIGIWSTSPGLSNPPERRPWLHKCVTIPGPAVKLLVIQVQPSCFDPLKTLWSSLIPPPPTLPHLDPSFP